MAKKTGKNGQAFIGSAKTITDAVYSAGKVTITASVHGLSAGDMVLISSVEGMTDINGHFVIYSVTTNTFKIEVTTSQTYTSGGTAQKTLEITKWEEDQTDSIIDATDSASSGWREKINKGLKNSKGTLTGYFYDTNDPDALVGQEISLKLLRDAGDYWSGTAFIKSIGETLEVEGESIVSVTYEWEGSGEWTEITP